MNDIYNFPWVKIYIDIEKEDSQVQTAEKWSVMHRNDDKTIKVMN